MNDQEVKAEDLTDRSSIGDDSSAAPTPKRRKTIKKAAATEAATSEAVSANSPPAPTIHDLAAAAASQMAPSSSAAPGLHSHASHPSAPAHSHAHQHAHAHTPHAPHAAHAHHHHHHHVPPHAHAPSRPPFSSSTLNLDTPLNSLTLRDLVAFHEGLQSELGMMRELMSRTEQHLAQGDRLVGVLQSAIAAAGTSGNTSAGASAPPAPAPALAVAGNPVPESSAPKTATAFNASSAEPQAAPAIAEGGGSRITSGRRTEQDLEEYLAGLPEMAAVPLRKKAEEQPAVNGDEAKQDGTQQKAEAVEEAV